MLLDEAERLKESTPDMTELRTSLLAGYKAGTVATRMERVEDSFRTEYFDIFGPKALACINNLPPALASRCIPIMMFRASPKSLKPRRRIDEQPHLWQRLRDNLHIMALENGTMWLDLAKRSDVCPEMSGRHYELWQPLLALAAWIEEAGASRLLSLMQEHAIATNEATRGEQTPDTDETLLRVLAEKISQGETPTAKAVLNYVQKQELDLFKSWSPRGVASHLARYGLKTNKTKGQKVYCQVTLDDLRHIELNYGLDLGLPEEESGSSSRDTVTNVPYVPYVPQEGQLDVLGEGT